MNDQIQKKIDQIDHKMSSHQRKKTQLLQRQVEMQKEKNKKNDGRAELVRLNQEVNENVKLHKMLQEVATRQRKVKEINLQKKEKREEEQYFKMKQKEAYLKNKALL